MINQVNPGVILPLSIVLGTKYPFRESVEEITKWIDGVMGEAVKPPTAVKFDCLWEVFPAMSGVLAWSHTVPPTKCLGCF